MGDVNGDRVINASDSLITLKIASGEQTATLEQEYAGDINGNGSIQSVDASMILYYAANGHWPLLPQTSARFLSNQTVSIRRV